MMATCLADALHEAVEDVLEKMFFAEAAPMDAETGPPEELVAARVDFEGSPSGRLNLRITVPAARALAADFLGEEASDLSPDATAEVIGELANMICGSLLSRVESDTAFRLSAPVVAFETGPLVRESDGPASRLAALESGALRVCLVCESALP